MSHRNRANPRRSPAVGRHRNVQPRATQPRTTTPKKPTPKKSVEASKKPSTTTPKKPAEPPKKPAKTAPTTPKKPTSTPTTPKPPAKKSTKQVPDAAPKNEQEEESERDMSVVSIAELKKACKAYGIRGYSKKKKNEIVEMLTSSYGDDEDVQKMALLVKNVKNLKKICFQLGIKGYSKKKKRQLVDLICRTKKEKANIKAEMEESLETYDEAPWVSNEAILKAYDYMVLRNYDITISELIQAIYDNESKLQKDFVRIIARRTRKSFNVKAKSNE